MDALILAQTVFYFVASLAIIVLGTLGALVIYYLIQLARNLSNTSYNLDLAVIQLKETMEQNINSLSSNLSQIIEKLSNLPLLSLFLKKTSNKKGRK